MMSKTKIAFILAATAVVSAWLIVPDSKPAIPAAADDVPELDELSRHAGSFVNLASFFRDIAERKGAAYAFGALRGAPLPPNTDLHLLAHHVGDVLYQQRGLRGIQICTDEFRNACSHSIVIGLFFDHGVEALPDIAEACRAAPGGSGAYTMCFHGLGHGILAYAGYDLPKTVELCRKTATPAYQGREADECVGGAIMEIISGGDHDKELWRKESPKYFRVDDLLYPCTANFIPSGGARLRCLSYLTPHLFAAAGADLGRPQPKDYGAAFRFCDRISAEKTAERTACFGGFGKEFTVLAQDRDVRRIDQMDNGRLRLVYEWCLLAADPDGINACIEQAMQSLYWGGENDRGAAIRFCGIIDQAGYRRQCFSDLIGAVGFYNQDRDYRQSFCGEIATAYKKECETQLLH